MVYSDDKTQNSRTNSKDLNCAHRATKLSAWNKTFRQE